jgi:hypothetical protein
MYQPEELTLVGCQLGVARGDWLVEERHQSGALMEDSLETVARCVAFDDEVVVEVRKLEYWHYRQGALECLECPFGHLVPTKTSLLG